MKRAVLAFVLAFGFVVSAFGQDFRFVENNGQITITGRRGRANDVVIPEQINGMPVVAIGYRAFYRDRLTSVTIPNGVTNIAGRAFYRNRLLSVTIPNGVTYIGYRVFYRNRLISVTIPNSVTRIGNRAFYNNQLTNVTIPNRAAYIGERAFYGNQLSTVTIPNSVTHIGERAFYGNQLSTVTIPNSVTHIGNRAFDGNRLSTVSVPNDTNVGNRAFGRATVTRSAYTQAVSALFAIDTNDAIDAILARAIDDVSRGLATTSRIAILEVSSSVEERSMAEFVTGELELILWRRGFTIVSRSDLDRIRSEQQLGLTGEVDDNTAAGIGRIAGASVILTGGIDGTGDLRRLRLRALSTETGQVIGVTAERI